MAPSRVEWLCRCNLCNVWFTEGGLHHISDNIWSLVWHTERSQKFRVPQISRCSLGLPAHVPDTSPSIVGPEFWTGECAATVSSPVGKWQLPWLACKIFTYNNLYHKTCSLMSLVVTLLIRKFPASTEFHDTILCLQRSKLDPILSVDRLCGLVVRVSGYRYRGPGFDSRRYQIFWVVVGLERGPLSLVRSTEELLE